MLFIWKQYVDWSLFYLLPSCSFVSNGNAWSSCLAWNTLHVFFLLCMLVCQCDHVIKVSKFGYDHIFLKEMCCWKTCQIQVVNMPNTLNMSELCFTMFGVQTRGGVMGSVYNLLLSVWKCRAYQIYLYSLYLSRHVTLEPRCNAVIRSKSWYSDVSATADTAL